MTNQNWTIKAAEGRAHWLAKEYVPADLRNQLESADLLLLPQDGFRDFAGPLYPVGTEAFLRSLQQDAPRGFSVDVTVSDADYKELALHADWLILASIFIGSSVVVPTAVNMISEYLKRRIWPEDPKRGMKVKLLLEQRNGEASQCVEVSYEGPANEFDNSMGAVFTELRGRGFPIPNDHDLAQPTARKANETPKTKVIELPASSTNQEQESSDK